MYYVIYDHYCNGDQILEEILSVNDAQLRVAELEDDGCISNVKMFETRHMLQMMLKRITELEEIIKKQNTPIDNFEDDDD